MDKTNWKLLAPNVALSQGAILRTEVNSTVDVILNSSGTSLRLAPSTLVEVVRLEREVAGEDVITRTELELRAGALIGSQRKLDNPSTFQIDTRSGAVRIRGTKYLVQADGTVRCFTGQIWLADNFAGNPAVIDVPAGFAFDPTTKAIAPIAPDLLSVVAVDLDAVHQNERNEKRDSGHAVVDLTHDRKMSPGKGHHHHGEGGGGDDHGGGDDNGGSNENGGGNGNGNDPGNGHGSGNKGGTPGHSN